MRLFAKISDTVWLALMAGGVAGALLLWLALNDPWWLVPAVVLAVLAHRPDTDGRGRR